MSRKRRKKGPRSEERGAPPAVAPTSHARSRPGEREGEEREGEEREAEQTARRPFDVVRENIEALVVAVVLALIIRHFSVEAFEIPTGSMATTLNGIHAWLECPNCDCEFNVALQSDSATGQLKVPYQLMRVYEGPCPVPGAPTAPHQVLRTGMAEFSLGGSEYALKSFPIQSDLVRSTRAIHRAARCPECNYHYTAIIEEGNRYGGHKILVTKFAYQVSDPARWDVIVFSFDQWKNYIKRLIGLPGERIDIWDGDIYVNGSIERKAEHAYIQEVLWHKISDSDRPKRDLPGSSPAWVELAEAKGGRDQAKGKFVEWDSNTQRWSVNTGDELAVLDYQHPFDDYTAYNLINHGIGQRGVHIVGDKKVAFTVRPIELQGAQGATDGWLGAEIRDRDHSFQVRIPVGPATEGREAVIARLTHDQGTLPNPNRSAHPDGQRVSTPLTLPFGQPVRIEFENIDDRVALRIDSEEKLVLNYSSIPADTSPSDITPPSSSSEHSLRLLFAKTQGMLESVQVYRDIYYIDTIRHFGGIQLGPDEYLALGDNSASSSDGRYWGSVPGKSLMGKAFVVIWPLWPTNFQGKRIR